MTFSDEPREMSVNRRIDRFPDDERDRRGNGDGDQRRQKAAADLAAGEPRGGADAPDFEEGNDGYDRDDGRYRLAQEREVAIGTGLQAGKLADELGLDPERSIEAFRQRNREETGDRQDGDRGEEIMRQECIAVVQPQRPDRPYRQIDDDGGNVPRYRRDGCAAWRRRRVRRLGRE